ncbi:hypothetical protein CORC01_03587 [Colletotrichum orchidophilum]|uniref:Uncharacterized protein n=1 Tax=Colletotrichum orchidophilum TaxID=1209926 RepID=A0A1G4BHM9_9PEZI|nr:uncharacterized protein CORC01_03587 [Colletotrichum orchidophilum]OHF01020.1 hypothetical protein CORC01_03587 [Colletotrichum orchidophilum]
MLCENRPEGFGPKSALSSHLPTTCFADVIVVPLATWTYLIILLIAVPPCVLSRRASASASASPSNTAEASTAGDLPSDKVVTSAPASTSTPVTKSPSAAVKVASAVYYLLIVAMLAMVSLEMARLSVAQLGIGVLPFTYVGILAALVIHVAVSTTSYRSGFGRVGMHIYGGDARWQWTAKVVNVLYWVMLMCAMAIKVASQAQEQNVLGVRTGQQAQYPISDSITDNATMMGVELVLLILELLTI